MFKLTTNDTEGQTPEIQQSLHELARQGARRMILAALELEVQQYVQALRHVRDEQGHAMVVRNGRSHHEPTVNHEPGQSRSERVAWMIGVLTIVSPARSCRHICIVRLVWKRHCRCCTCKACRPATSRKR